MPQSQLTKKSRHLGIGVFIVHSSMVLLLYIEQDKPNWQIKNWKGKKVKIPCRDDDEIKTNGMTKMANTQRKKKYMTVKC
jgi:hypothetical protein